MNQLLDPRPVDPRPVEPRPAVLPSRKKPRKRNESRSVIGFMYIVFWYCLAFFFPPGNFFIMFYVFMTLTRLWELDVIGV
jgi:hypothetical protein